LQGVKVNQSKKWGGNILKKYKIKYFCDYSQAQLANFEAGATGSITSVATWLNILFLNLTEFEIFTHFQLSQVDAAEECCKFGLRLLTVETKEELQCIVDMNNG